MVRDSGTELTSHAILRWQKERGESWRYIATREPQQIGIVESFTGRCTDERLNEHLFSNVAAARRSIAAWSADYGTERWRRRTLCFLVVRNKECL